MQHKKAVIPVLFILLQDLLYGFGDPISKYVYESVPVYSVLTARYWLAFLFLMLLFGKKVMHGLKNCSWKALFLPSMCIAAAFVISNFAMKLTSATAVAFLRSTSTVITPLLALVVYGKHYSRKQIPVLIFVLIGLYLLCGSGGLSGFGIGEVLAMLAAALMAGSLVFAGEALRSIDPITVTTVQAGASAVLATGCAFVFDGGIRLETAAPSSWLVILYLVTFCTMAGYLLQNYALKSIPASTVALLQCAYPVMTAFFSFLILRERLTWLEITGAVIILSCIVAENVIPGDAQRSRKDTLKD